MDGVRRPLSLKGEGCGGAAFIGTPVDSNG
jgi:hypothetical protein